MECAFMYRCGKDVSTHEKYKTIYIQIGMVVINRHRVMGEFLLYYLYFYFFLLFLFNNKHGILKFFTCKIKFN